MTRESASKTPRKTPPKTARKTASRSARPKTRLLRFDGATRHDPAVDAWLATQPPHLADIARAWFAVMRRCGNDVTELLHDGHPTACVGDAGFGYVNVFSAHVNIGFFQGATLPDPAGLLQGTGKAMRHVKARPGTLPDDDALREMIRAAYHDIKARIAAEADVAAPAASAAGAAALPADIARYHATLNAEDQRLCALLAATIGDVLPEAVRKVWHAHPVWFLDGNPIVGYSRLKDGIRLLFWSGQSFTTPGLRPEGKFKAAEARFASADAVDVALLKCWLAESREIQWDYQNIVRRKGRLERLTQFSS